LGINSPHFYFDYCLDSSYFGYSFTPTAMEDPYASEWKKAQIAQLIAEAQAVIKIPVSSLPQHHRDVFDRALQKVLATDLAQITYAQIIDGFPIVSVAKDMRWAHIDHEHPVFANKHDKVCPGAWEKMEEFHSSFSVDVLSMNERVGQPPSQSTHGSSSRQLNNTPFFSSYTLTAQSRSALVPSS
jgi:hypothetical protein